MCRGKTLFVFNKKRKKGYFLKKKMSWCGGSRRCFSDLTMRRDHRRSSCRPETYHCTIPRDHTCFMTHSRGKLRQGHSWETQDLWPLVLGSCSENGNQDWPSRPVSKLRTSHPSVFPSRESTQGQSRRVFQLDVSPTFTLTTYCPWR